jgi:hypothetical protein
MDSNSHAFAQFCFQHGIDLWVSFTCGLWTAN